MGWKGRDMIRVHETRSRWLACTAPLVLALSSSACSAEGAAPGAEPRASAAAKPATTTARAATTPAPISETDRHVLAQAQAACRDGDAASFFDSFIQSAAVRSRYSAPVITRSVFGPGGKVIRSDEMAQAHYTAFPIQMVDYYRKPVKPARPGDDGEYVEIDLNQSQSNRISVEWTRVHYDGKSEGGDDLGAPFTLDGQPYSKGSSAADGQLLFEPFGDCWRLTADVRFARTPG